MVIHLLNLFFSRIHGLAGTCFRAHFVCLFLEYTDLLEHVLKHICCPASEQGLLDSKGNTALHTSTMEEKTTQDTRARVLDQLLQADFNPHIKNRAGCLPYFYLPRTEDVAAKILFMYMQDPGGEYLIIPRRRRRCEAGRAYSFGLRACVRPSR
jgi:hypothetical protein